MRTSTRGAKPAARLAVETLEDRVNPVAAYALSGTNLIAFDTASLTTATTTPIITTGVLTTGETLVGIDFRPQNGLLYALGVNATADTGTLYTLSTRTGQLAVVGTASSIAGVGDLPDPTTGGYGFDFNPTVDRI